MPNFLPQLREEEKAVLLHLHFTRVILLIVILHTGISQLAVNPIRWSPVCPKYEPVSQVDIWDMADLMG